MKQIHADAIAGCKNAIAALEKSIAAREANVTASYYGISPFTANSTIHAAELRQLEELNTELRILEAKYGNKA